MDPASDPVARLDYRHIIISLREKAGGHESGSACANDDDTFHFCVTAYGRSAIQGYNIDDFKVNYLSRYIAAFHGRVFLSIGGKQLKEKLFKAFKSRNYRLYFFGQSFSLIGTWMQRTAVYWLVYEISGSAFVVGITVFCAQFPSFLLSILGGVVSDRYNRFRVLLFTQVASLVQALALALLVFHGGYALWHILVLTVLLGAINAFDVPRTAGAGL